MLVPMGFVVSVSHCLSLSFSFQTFCILINLLMILSKALTGIQEYTPFTGQEPKQGNCGPKDLSGLLPLTPSGTAKAS